MSARDATISPVLSWAALTGLIAWGAYALWRAGMLARLVEEDPSKLSLVILAVYALTHLYAGWLAVSLHRDRRLLSDYTNDPRSGRAPETSTTGNALLDYVDGRARRGAETPGEEGFAYVRALVSDRLSSGWFVADLMFKLGLVGTVIGFILMLGAITDLRSMDIQQAQAMLGEMSAGMRLALYTTLTGLACGALTGIQFHLLERSADALSREVGALLENAPQDAR